MSALNRQQVLVLGGGYAGTVAAARIAAGAPRAEVTLVDARPGFVQRIRMHELIAGGEPQVMPYARLMDRGVNFRQGTVEGIDTNGGWAEVRPFHGDTLRLPYDALVLALGSRTSASVPGVLEHAVRLNDPVEVRAVARRLRNSGAGHRVVVVGAGLTGVETATELAQRHPLLRVTLVASGSFGAEFSQSGAAYLRRALGELSITLREHAHVVAVERGRLHLEDGAVLPFGTCVWTGGFATPGIAREAGLPVLADGRAIVEPSLRVAGQDRVYAAGDAAAVRMDGSILRMGCVTAGPMGAHAGTSVARALGGRAPGDFAFAYFVRCISLGRRDGLVQPTSRDDEPARHVLRGRAAAVVKELVCRITYWNVVAEVRGLRSSWWPQPAPRRLTGRTEEIARDLGLS